MVDCARFEASCLWMWSSSRDPCACISASRRSILPSSSRPYPARSPGFFLSLYSQTRSLRAHQPHVGSTLSHFTFLSLHNSQLSMSLISPLAHRPRGKAKLGAFQEMRRSPTRWSLASSSCSLHSAGHPSRYLRTQMCPLKQLA